MVKREINRLSNDVKKFEPKRALDGGNDGLDVIKKVIYKSQSILKLNGILALEIGRGQYFSVLKILKQNGFKKIKDIKDYKELTLETRLNGQVMQNAKLSQLIFDIPILISYVSKAMAWRAGDVLVTGTPGGVGFKRKPPIFMKDGDKVEVEISEIGVLSNIIKDEKN